MGHRSEWTGLECRRQEVTGKPCDGRGHVSISDDYPDQKVNADSQKED